MEFDTNSDKEIPLKSSPDCNKKIIHSVKLMWQKNDKKKIEETAADLSKEMEQHRIRANFILKKL